MRRRYSRLAQVEKQKSIKAIIVYGFLTLLLIVLIFVFGLPAVAKFAGFLADLRGSSQPVEILDKTPPAPPNIEALPEYVNYFRLSIKGSAEAGTTVTLFYNSGEKELLVESDGSFSTNIDLQDGENKIHAIAMDKAGNQSVESKFFTVTYDDDPPILEIQNPSDGQSFQGSLQRQLTIQGKTEAGSSVTVNENIAIVDSEGNFTYSTSLEEGENQFTIQAEDQAGNSTTKSLKVNFSP